MKHIVYLNNYMLEDIINERNNKNIFSQPANNKINAIRKSLEVNKCDVKILSSGLVNNRSFKKYKRLESELDKNVVYSPIIDIPLINTFSSALFMFFEIKKLNSKKPVDNIIFYNYKPEVAWAAWLSKKYLKIPITLEYEDGYYSVESIKGIKKMIFNYTEKIVSKNIDSAILVTSKLKSRVKTKNTVVRGMVDNDFLLKCKNKKERNENITILYSGGLDKERGIEVLLESIDYIEEDFKLIISGKGNLEHKVIEKKDDRIEFIGFVDYSIVKENLMNADILVNCQLENHDFGEVSFPSKIFEYIATGNRIISSGVSDIKDFGKGCFYFYDDDDPKELAKAIKRAINDIENNKNEFIKNIENLCVNNTYENIGKDIINIL